MSIRLEHQVMRRVRRAAIGVALALAIAGLSAHAQYRIIGVITKVTPASLEVRQTKDGKLIAMDMDSESFVTRDKKRVSRAELKVGSHVVVDACGDSLKELLVMEVRLVPAPQVKK